MHELGPEPNFNESMYFNVFDPVRRVGGFFRLGNRANEGTGEMTACVYLPDGRVGFMFRRPVVTTNDAFDAAGMRFEVVEPFEGKRVRSHCLLRPDRPCRDSGACSAHTAWGGVNEAYRTFLERTSVADIQDAA